MSRPETVVVGADDVATVGQAVLSRAFAVEPGTEGSVEGGEMRLGLVWWRGSPWRWSGGGAGVPGKWVQLDRKDFLDELWMWLGMLVVETETQDGVRRRKWGVTGQKVSDVARWIEARVAMRDVAVPGDLRKTDGARPCCVTFEDRVVDCTTGESFERGAWWFDPCTIPVKWGEGGGRGVCPTWMSCLEAWSRGDPEWVEALRRVMGYALMGWRGLQRWVLFYGVPRAGKSLTDKVLKAMLGSSVVDRSLVQMAEKHGMAGTEGARVLSVGEVTRLGSRDRTVACGLLKSIVGQDTISSRPLYGGYQTFESQAMVLMVSNELPHFSDTAQGLTSKMILIPFEVSFLGREDEGLRERLMGELEGIARWAVGGAMAVLREEGGRKLFTPPAAKALVEAIQDIGDPLAEWISEVFEPKRGEWVTHSTIRRLWNQTGLKDRTQFSDAHLPTKVFESLPKEWGAFKSKSGSQRQISGIALRPGVRDRLSE